MPEESGKVKSRGGENYKSYFVDNFDLFWGAVGGQSPCETHLRRDRLIYSRPLKWNNQPRREKYI